MRFRAAEEKAKPKSRSDVDGKWQHDMFAQLDTMEPVVGQAGGFVGCRAESCCEAAI